MKVTAEIKKEFENRMFHARSVLDYIDVNSDVGEQQESWTYRKKRTGEIANADDSGVVAYRRFWANMSTPEVDFYNTVVAAEAVREAFPEWIKGGNSRLMHESRAAGRVFPEDYQILPDAIRVGISIPGHKKDILADIDASLLRGVSLGFWPDWDMATYDQKTGIITFHRIRIAEVSIVDWGATPGTELAEERKMMFDRAMAFVRKQIRNGENTPMEDLNMDELKELFERFAKDIGGKVDAITGELTELRSTVDTLKTVSDEEQTPGPTEAEKRFAEMQKCIESQNKTINEIRSLFTTEEALSPEHIKALETLAQDRDKDPDPASVPFAFGCIRSTVTGRAILNGNDLLN